MKIKTMKKTSLFMVVACLIVGVLSFWSGLHGNRLGFPLAFFDALAAYLNFRSWRILCNL